MQTLLKFGMLMCMVFLCVLARGQTPITITGPDTLCKGSSGAYAISPTTGFTYTWSVTSQGNIQSPGNSGATVVWNGTGLATLTVNGVNGGSTQQGNKTVYILPPPEPQMTWNAQVGCQITNPLGEGHDSSETSIGNSTCLRVCENSYVTYSVPNGGATSTFAWTVAGGTIISGGTSSSCVVHWGAAGNGSITVTETDAYGCSGSKTKCIEIIPGPTADFSVNPGLSACINQLLYFTDISSVGTGSPIVSWYWSFGDGTYSAVQNPTHAYTSGGTYPVTLIVKNECNCTDTVTYDIEVSDVQAIPIHCPIVVCEGEKDRYWVDLTQLSDMGISCPGPYIWDASPYGTVVSSGVTGSEAWVVIKWNSAPMPTSPDGFGYVTFDASTCTGTCPGLVVAKVPIIGTETQITGPSTICANKQYRYTLPQWPATLFTWTLSPSTGATLIPTDQPNEYIVQANFGGTYTLKATWKKTMPIECGSSAELVINVEPPVIVSGLNKACENSSQTYTLSGTSNPGDWTLNGPGGFLQTGTGTSTFNANFTVPGTYTLTVSGSFCSPDPLIIKVAPTPPAVDSIDGPDTICLGTPYTFTAFDAVPGSNFYWEYEDGTGPAVVLQNPGTASITFTDPNGPYKIRVWRKLKDAPYCESAKLEKVLYTPKVVADITGPTTVCANTTANYNAGYALGDTYVWSINPSVDGSIATGNNTPNVTVQWNKVTTAHFVDLYVKITKCGVTDEDTLKVWVTPTVNVTITGPTTECRGVPVTFGFTPSVSPYTSITWDFGDNTSIVTGTTAPTHTYNSSIQANTTYTVSLEITDPNGCTVPAKANHTITIKPAPVANITPVGPINVCPPATHTTTLTATIQSGFGGPTTGINWYEASAPTISLNTTTSYAPPGNGTYYAVVTNPNGCTAQTNQVVFGSACPGSPCTISPNPTVSASCSLSDCGEVTVTGSHTGSPVSGPVWTYPPQVTSVSGTNPKVFTFDKAGYYDFSYKVTYMGTSGLCEREDKCTTTVPFIADLKYKLTCGTGNYNLTLLDNSNYIVPITNFAFYLYTGTIGTPAQSGTSTQYTTTVTPGVLYNAALKISAPGYPDCWAFVPIQVPALPVANFVASPNPGCVNTPISFTNTSTPSTSPSVLTSDWNFLDGASVIMEHAKRVYSSTLGGGYNVTLTVTDKYGCTDVETKNVTIMSNGLVGELDISPVKFCKGDPFTISYDNQGTASPITYTWKKDGVILPGSPTTSGSYSPLYDPGSYWVEVEGNWGCKAATPAKPADHIHVPDAIIDGEKNYCSGEMVVLNGDGGPGVTDYKWYRNGSLIASGNVPILNDYVAAVGTYIYKLEISVTDGGVTCTNTSANFPVTISMPALPPGLSFTINDCATYEVEITATSSTTGTYTWSNGMSGNPITVYEGGPYKVFFQADNGCEASAEIDVPKDPEVYLWVFPTGCKALCAEFFPFTLYGPIIPFNRWEWKEHSGTASWLVGTGLVSPYQVTGPGQYTLTLDNGYCSDESGVLDLTMIKDCCDDVQLDVMNVQQVDDNGKCRYDLDVQINNPGPHDMDVWLSSSWGTFKYGPPPYTGSMNVPAGSQNFQVEFHPNPGFPGGPTWIKIVSQQMTDDGQIVWCKDSIEVDFPPCAGPCEVEMSLDNVWIEDPCQIKVRLYMNNMSGVTVNGTFTTPYGTLSPATTSIGPGGGYYTFNFTPYPAYVGGGWSTIKFTTSYMGTDGQVHYCDQDISVEFPEQCITVYEPCGFGLFIEYFQGPNEPCNYNAYLAVHNPFPGTKPVTITSNVGTFSPSTYNVPSGMWNWLSPTPVFTPNPGFSGGMAWIILSSYYINSDGDTVHCADSFHVNLPGCGGIIIGGKHSYAGDGDQSLKDQSPDMFGQLLLMPNPSKGVTTLKYHYTGDDANHERNIDVYDVMGRLIERVYVKGDTGVHILRLDNQPPGVYTVMMKEDGKTIQHQKLVIAK
ncbi:PKD domain-containing protein [Polluticoccus soli]|uniref:PKD domain-containing protein n=1 Tax=Polluticoccus soli TaxID=3034150 RepID=UPI0023E1008A|nr:PKD domain-containing protein [Flavipsychrobacter sp. JY13-12]